jgi:two-component system chemotaxis sensor kinase CheA
MDDLLVDFITETRETLETLSSEIVAWESSPSDRTRLDSIFRFVHTVKGSCGFLNLPRLEKLSHAAEDVLADCRAERRKPDAALVTAVLLVIDRISEVTNALESGESVPDHDDAVLIAALAPGGGVEVVAVEEEVAPSAVVANTAQKGMSRSIRLPVDLLDRMMAGVSDMVLARNDLSRRLRDSGGEPIIDAAFERLSVCIAEMRDSITRTRMARIENLFSALPRMVRDLTAELGKQVTLEIDGGDVELDREMIEMIRDPLTHIVRNAIDHGIEMPDERLKAGKSPTGRLRVSARQAGNQIVIEAIDDGRGINADKLVEKAIANGMLTEEKAATMSLQNKLHLIFAAGLSTAKAVTSVSGRGVGMDVVRANVERIGGLVDIDSKLGQGLRLSLKVPLTLTIIPALTVSAGGTHFAIPRSAIEELVRVSSGSAHLGELGGAKMVNIRGRRLPVVMLANFLKLNSTCADSELTMVVLKPAGGDHYALAVDAVHDHEELVVKPAAPALMATGIYAGTTLPDNSHPMLLLDPAGIAQSAHIIGEAGNIEDVEPETAIAVDECAPTLLFRDLDGAERAIRLDLVERIEEIPASAVSHIAGRMRVSYDERIIPLMSCGVPSQQDRYRILRMTDGLHSIVYAISEVIDIVAMDFTCERALAPGLIAGVALIDGRPVELIDTFWLFSEAAREAVGPAHPPLCLLTDADDPWSRQVLLPLLRTAGYRVTFSGAEDADDADVAIAIGDGLADLNSESAAVRTIRLSTDPEQQGGDTIYRYDRDALLDALNASAKHKRRAA